MGQSPRTSNRFGVVLANRWRRVKSRPITFSVCCLLSVAAVYMVVEMASWDGYLGPAVRAPQQTYPQFQEPSWIDHPERPFSVNSSSKAAPAQAAHLSAAQAAHLHHPIEQPQQDVPSVVRSGYVDLKTIYHSAPAAARSKASSASVTVVISCFVRPGSIEEVIQSYLAQSAVIAKVIVYLSGSPVRHDYMSILNPLVEREPRVEVFDLGGVNLGYFGRLQLGIQTFTDFIIFTDDDIEQGRFVIEALMTAFYSGEYPGVLGVRGCNFICSKAELEGEPTTSSNQHEAGVQSDGPLSASDIRLCSQGPSSSHHIPPSGSEVDTLFSFWLMPSSWVRTLFMEAPPTYRTAEDMHISYIIRKYLGKATYQLRSWHQDFDGNRQPDVGLANRSWVDSTGLTADQLAIKLPELDAKLSGAIEPSVKKRKYNWERDQTMRLLAERGNSLARISWIRRWPLTFSAIVLLGPEDVVPLMEQAVNEVIKDPHVSLFVVCHSGQCDEYRSINNQFLKEMLFGSHQRLLEAKVYRVRPPTHHIAIFYSRLLLDLATLVKTLKVQQVSYLADTSYHLELSVLKPATKMHKVILEQIS